MLPEQVRRPWWQGLATVVGVWLAIAVALTGQTSLVLYSLQQAHADLPKDLPGASLTELFINVGADCLIWAVLTLAVFWLGRRFPLTRGRWPKSVAVHAAACVVVAAVHTVLTVLASEVLRHDLTKPTITANVLFYFFVAKMNNNIFFYWGVLAVCQIVDYYRQAREREVRASQLEAKLAQTQLQILKMQLHPHFLFNTLNAISALIHQDVDLADRMIARLGDLLRTTLDNAHTQEVALKQELDFIEPYLEIEKARLGARLTVGFDVDPAAMDAKVPNLILQPLVENAIRHGIAPRPGPGRIDIAARRENGCLHLTIVDDGPGLAAADGAADGIGLANTRARLEKLYGDKHRFELDSASQRGLRVGITIPFVPADV